MINHVEPYYGKAEIKAITNYLKSGGFLTEYKVSEEFERQLASFLGVKYVSLVPNGTSAIYLSLLASGVGKGDKVAVPDLTMIATANAVRMTGAIPMLVDIDLNGCMEIEQVKLDKRLKAVVYVELNGRSENMKKIRSWCKGYQLILIEDACQALGSKYKDKYLGTFGRFGCFSLGFHKIITTGQGGFIVSHSKKDYEIIERLKDFGRLKGGNDVHDYLGFNFKFTDLQAVIGLEQLKTIKWRMEKKRQLYEWYTGMKASSGWVPWFIEVWSEYPKQIKEHLKNNGVESRLIYPPIHTQKIYKGRNFFMAEHISWTGLWLPSSLNLTEKEVKRIKKLVLEVDKNAYF